MTRWLIAGAMVLVAAPPLRAQATPVVAGGDSVSADSITPPVHPMRYFARSLVLPGWGQAALGRKLTGGLFIGFEGLAIGMAMKADNELRYLDATDSTTASLRRGERQDWIVLLAFNHLFSALEAYVSAHMVGFPQDLHLRAIPGPRPGFGVVIGTP